jgi:hypothetical protein
MRHSTGKMNKASFHQGDGNVDIIEVGIGVGVQHHECDTVLVGTTTTKFTICWRKVIYMNWRRLGEERYGYNVSNVADVVVVVGRSTNARKGNAHFRLKVTD